MTYYKKTISHSEIADYQRSTVMFSLYRYKNMFKHVMHMYIFPKKKNQLNFKKFRCTEQNLPRGYNFDRLVGVIKQIFFHSGYTLKFLEFKEFPFIFKAVCCKTFFLWK